MHAGQITRVLLLPWVVLNLWNQMHMFIWCCHRMQLGCLMQGVN